MTEESNKDTMTEAQAMTQKVGFWKDVWNQIRLVYYLMFDREVPIYLKALPLSALIYVLWPIDLLTDFVPIVGQLDDITAVLVGVKVFIEMSPPHVVAKYMDMLDGPVDTSGGLFRNTQEGNELNLDEAIIVDAEHEIIVEKQPEDLE